MANDFSGLLYTFLASLAPEKPTDFFCGYMVTLDLYVSK